MTSYEAQVYFSHSACIVSAPIRTYIKLADSSQSQPGENKKGAKTVREITATFDATAAKIIAIWYTTYFAAYKNH